MIKFLLLLAGIVAIWYFLDKSKTKDDTTDSEEVRPSISNKETGEPTAPVVEESQNDEVTTSQQTLLTDVEGIPASVVAALNEAGFMSVDDIKGATDDALLSVKGIGAKRLESIRKLI